MDANTTRSRRSASKPKQNAGAKKRGAPPKKAAATRSPSKSRQSRATSKSKSKSPPRRKSRSVSRRSAGAKPAIVKKEATKKSTSKSPSRRGSGGKARSTKSDSSPSGSEFKLLLNSTPPQQSSLLNTSLSPLKRTPPTRSLTSTPQRTLNASLSSSSLTTTTTTRSGATAAKSSKAAVSSKLCPFFNSGYLHCTRQNILSIVVASVLLIAVLILFNNKSALCQAVSDVWHSITDLVGRVFSKAKQ